MQRTRTNHKTKRATKNSPFACPIEEHTELGLAMLMVEDETGHYEPLGVVVSISEGREVAEDDFHRRLEQVKRGEEPLLPALYKVFARVDHAAGAKRVNMPLPPTELLIFGKPDAGTLLMQSQRTVGIDLPLKYLVWESADGQVMIGWNDAAWTTQRHGIEDRAPVVQKMQGALRKFASEAAAP